MQYEQRCFEIVRENEEIRTVQFDCIPLGRAVGEKIGPETYSKGVEIHLTDKGAYIIYVYFRDENGNIESANYTEVKSLELGVMRSSLKEVGIYPGPMFSEAVYHSTDTLELLS